MPAITKPNQHFNATLYTGTGSARSVTGVGFQPNFVWIKERSSTSGHALFDVVRGVQKRLVSNGTDAEDTSAQLLTAFNSDGFSVGTDGAINENTQTYVGWQWKAGGTSVINTSGTISSNVSANPTAGFSIIQFTATGATANVGHGLGVAPQMIIVKDAASEGNWAVWHTSLTSTAHYLFMNTTAAQASASAIWTGTPSSTTFGIGSWHTADRQIAYCFAPIAGYSAFGKYTGNGSTDGAFVYTGFRPRFVLIRSTSNLREWFLVDTARNSFNVANSPLRANSTGAEGTDTVLDMVSNGFKLRSSDTAFNASETYIYAAFAEAPFKFANAR